MVKKWRGVRGIHIKGPTTAALPIWLADELWTDEADVLEDAPEVAEGAVANISKKRKAGLSAGPEEESKKVKIEKAKKLAVVSEDSNLDAEIKARKEKLRKQKEEAAAEVAEPLVEKKVKKAKKAKA